MNLVTHTHKYTLHTYTNIRQIELTTNYICMCVRLGSSRGNSNPYASSNFQFVAGGQAKCVKF